MHRRSSVFTLYVLYNAAASLGVEITLNWFELFGSVQHITVHIAVMFSQFKLVCSVQDKTSHLQALHIKLIAQEVTMCKRGAMELSHHDHFCGFCGSNEGLSCFWSRSGDASLPKASETRLVVFGVWCFGKVSSVWKSVVKDLFVHELNTSSALSPKWQKIMRKVGICPSAALVEPALFTLCEMRLLWRQRCCSWEYFLRACQTELAVKCKLESNMKYYQYHHCL